MPHYTFRCEVCGEIFERYLSFQESLDEVRCPQGHRQVVRVYRPPAIVFKGSGFYITDHGRANNGNHARATQSTSKEAQEKAPSQKASPEGKKPVQTPA